MTKTSGPIYHLQIVLNKLLELLGFEALSLLPPYRTNPMKCLSTRTAKCWQCCCQLKGSLLWGFIHGGCGGAVERMESLKWENKGGRTSSKRMQVQRESQSFWGISARGWAGYLWQNSPLAETDSKWPDVWEKWGLPTCKSFRGPSNSLVTAEPPSQFCSSWGVRLI